MGDVSRIRVTGPLESYVSGFVVALMERGYTPVSIGHQLRLMAHVSRWLASEGFGSDDLSPARVEQFLAARRAAGYVNYFTPRALLALLEYLRDVGVAPPAGEPALSQVEELLGRYRGWLCSERGLAAVTARNYADMVRPFVAARLNATVATALLSNLVERGLDPEQGMLFVIDGSKALGKAVRTVFGEVPVQRCVRHYLDSRVIPIWGENRSQIGRSAA